MKLQRLLVLSLILLSTVGCDQATKKVASLTLAGSPPISIANDVVRFEYARNPGALLSLGATLPESLRLVLLIVGVGLVLLFVLVTTVRNATLGSGELTGLGFILGGGTGNLIDRLFHEGTVVDFVSLGIGPLRTGVFNVADVAIMGGACLLLYGSLRARRGQSEEGLES